MFASNRHAAPDTLSKDDRERLARDPSYFVDLYRLELATGELTRLTSAPGYDGGPFYSADGSRIVWRRFSEDGARAEIHAMNADGGEARALTRLGVMSWAPFFHPSGDYIVFSTNLHGFDDFELYLVDAAGQKEPVRVTRREGFDGLPVFSPEGDVLVWTSNRTEGKQSQLFRADWNDSAARAALGLPARPATAGGSAHSPLATAKAAPDDVRPEAIETHVEALADLRTEGRGTGSPGEALAAQYVEATLRGLGLVPAGDAGSFLQRFEFTAGIALGEENGLRIERGHGGPAPAQDPGTHAGSAAGTPPATASAEPVVDVDWRPLAFSTSGEIRARDLVFVGYGLVAPAERDHPAVGEYAGLDLEGRWAVVLGDLPLTLTGERRQHLQRHASLRHKAMIARDRGAVGIVFVNGRAANSGAPRAAALRCGDRGLGSRGHRGERIARRWLADSGGTDARGEPGSDRPGVRAGRDGRGRERSGGRGGREHFGDRAPIRASRPAPRGPHRSRDDPQRLA